MEFSRYQVIELSMVGGICKSQASYGRINVCGSGWSQRGGAQLRSCCLS